MTEKEKIHYCKKCPYMVDGAELNEDNFCGLGYKQNPVGFKATLNLAENSGPFYICPNNPWRKRVFVNSDLLFILKIHLNKSRGNCGLEINRKI